MSLQLGDHFLRETVNLIVQRAIAELQVMESDEVFDMIYREWYAHRDADGPDGQEFDHALDTNRAERTEAFHRWQTHHFRAMEKQLPRTAATGIHGEMRDRLAEQLIERLPCGVVRDIKSVDVNNLPGVTGPNRGCGLMSRFRWRGAGIHTRSKIARAGEIVEAPPGRSFADNSGLRGWKGLLIVGA
jgi:hypothetical protein